jgi:hypothetical protein
VNTMDPIKQWEENNRQRRVIQGLKALLKEAGDCIPNRFNVPKFAKVKEAIQTVLNEKDDTGTACYYAECRSLGECIGHSESAPSAQQATALEEK